MPSAFIVPRVPRELDGLAIRAWLAQQDRGDDRLDQQLQRAAKSGRRAARELAKRRRHALRLQAAVTAEGIEAERMRRAVEKTHDPWPDHWRSY